MADTSEKINKLGEILVLKAELVAHDNRIVDITAMMGELTLFEDLFSPTMSGSVFIQDALDLVNTLPMMGQEQLLLTLRTPTLTTAIIKTFYVYKMSARTAQKRVQNYVLHFCSTELIQSQNTKISKAFSGNISDSVVSIFRDPRYLASVEKLYVDRTKNDYSFIAPYWTPIEAINWLSAKSVNENGVPNYVFFESNQSFEFVSIDRLIRAEPVREYVYSDVDANTVYGADGLLEQKYNIVGRIDTSVTFDYLRNLSGGMLASKLYTFDMTTKNINVSTFDYIDDFAKSSHLDPFPIKADNIARRKLASIYFIEKNNYRTGDFLQQGYKDFFLMRNALMEQMNAFKMNIYVHGRTDIKVGNTIKFKMSEMRQILKNEIDTTGISDYYSGKYLVTAIKHTIMNGEHSMIMEIVSDSFTKKLAGTK